MKSEATVMQEVRLEVSRRNARVFRNNNGVAVDNRGNRVRYGFANESKQINQILKSSDLIGFTPVVITPDMVGKKVAIFTAIEVKKSSWKYTGDMPCICKPGKSQCIHCHEKAQNTFIDMINNQGGYAQFVTDPEELVI